MSAINDGGPINLGTPHEIWAGPKVLRASDMSLRDWFAGQAMAGSAANPDNGLDSDEDAASWCYAMADAMLAAKEARK